MPGGAEMPISVARFGIITRTGWRDGVRYVGHILIIGPSRLLLPPYRHVLPHLHPIVPGRSQNLECSAADIVRYLEYGTLFLD